MIETKTVEDKMCVHTHTFSARKLSLNAVTSWLASLVGKMYVASEEIVMTREKRIEPARGRNLLFS